MMPPIRDLPGVELFGGIRRELSEVEERIRSRRCLVALD